MWIVFDIVVGSFYVDICLRVDKGVLLDLCNCLYGFVFDVDFVEIEDCIWIFDMVVGWIEIGDC